MTYGFIELPFDLDELQKAQKKDAKSTTKLNANFKDAFSKAGNAIKNSIKNPTQTLKNLGTFLNDKNVQAVGSTISNTVNIATTKYSGIAIAQLLVDGKVTSKTALDYLFLGVAPALNQVGIALGYTSLGQIKRALFDGDINVGQFISGLSNTCKSIYNIATDNNVVNEVNSNKRIYFDMTLSDSSQYQSETPDRRVERGNDLSEFCHNLPPTFDVQAELQDGRRYSKEEFRGLLASLRDKMTPVTLYLGDEHFDNVILQNFSPNGQGSQKGGYEYGLQFKQIQVGAIEEVVITAFATAPSANISGNVSAGTQAIAGDKTIKGGTKIPNTDKAQNMADRAVNAINGKSITKQILEGESGVITLTNKYGSAFKPTDWQNATIEQLINLPSEMRIKG